MLAVARLDGAARHDRQATLVVSVGRTDADGFEAHVQRVDQPWPVEALWIDYLAWTPSLATVTDDRLRPGERPVSGTGTPGGADPLGQSPVGVLPGPAQPPCPRCVHRTASAVLEPYVLPRAQVRPRRCLSARCRFFSAPARKRAHVALVSARARRRALACACSASRPGRGVSSVASGPLLSVPGSGA